MSTLTPVREQRIVSLLAQIAIDLAAARDTWENDGKIIDHATARTEKYLRCARKGVRELERAIQESEKQIRREFVASSQMTLPGIDGTTVSPGSAEVFASAQEPDSLPVDAREGPEQHP